MYLPRERHELLLEQLKIHGSVRASDLARKLAVSSLTIRRDINELSDRGLLRRVHGGALSAEQAAVPRAARILVGIVVPSSSYYYPEVTRGAEQVAARAGVRLVLGVTDYSHEKEVAAVRRLLHLGVGGLLISPAGEPGDERRTGAWLDSLPVPVVVMERELDNRCVNRDLDSVRSDHARGVFLALRHFAGLGHRAVALAICPDTPTAPVLLKGYRGAVAALGLDGAPAVLLPNSLSASERMASLTSFLRAAVDGGVRAVFVHSDLQALELVDVATSLGMLIPRDLAVVTYDDEIANLGQVPLTSVAPPKREVGSAALEALVRRIRARDGIALAPYHLQLSPRLAVRESCGASRRLELIEIVR